MAELSKDFLELIKKGDPQGLRSNVNAHAEHQLLDSNLSPLFKEAVIQTRDEVLAAIDRIHTPTPTPIL